MSHLGERLTALVDGELEHDERDRVYAHLAACAACRAEAEALRRLKSELRSLDEAAPPSDFLARLHAMNGDPGDPGEPDRDVEPAGRSRRIGKSRGAGRGRLIGTTALVGATGLVGETWPAGEARAPGRSRPTGSRPPGAGHSRSRRGPSTARGRSLVVGAATLAVLGAGAASVAVTVTPDRLPQVAPALERFAVEHVLLNTGDAPTPATTPATSPVADRHSRP